MTSADLVTARRHGERRLLDNSGYRPWHRVGCAARTLWNTRDDDCSCPAEQFTHGSPVWEPGDEPRGWRTAIASTRLSRSLAEFQGVRGLSDEEMLTALTECVRWWAARVLTVQRPCKHDTVSKGKVE